LQSGQERGVAENCFHELSAGFVAEFKQQTLLQLQMADRKHLIPRFSRKGKYG
jgi:hypothetical protein